ncbi:MAG: NAD(P)/FAD-dependent oxidoreductase [Blastocatellia bacterium]|nr:NAD(P)/FAD-dependent oxidoreductase [Blastocatellia bacterium]
MTASKTHFPILIVGGGTAGLTVAARLANVIDPAEIGIIEPSTKHYYQPIWTLVGGGVFPKEVSEREEADFIPAGTKWIHDAVEAFSPEENALTTKGGKRLTYDFLVVAPGIQIDWGKVKGLKEAVGKDGVCSNYSYDTVQTTWDNIRQFQGGTAVFTQPPPPFKCGGAPQKIMYLADDAFRQNGVREKTKIVYASAAAVSFQVKKYADTMDKVIARKGIETRYKHNLVEIRAAAKEAVFKHTETGEETTIGYDMIHVTPPQSSPDFIKQSALASSAGWVDVDKATLQHVRFPNVFSLGDASSLPTSKTGAAVRKQAPIVVENLLALRQRKAVPASYDGYTSCPLVTGYGKLVMAEFDYDLKPQETFPFDQSQERYSMYLVKAHLLPKLYWYGMLRGRA